MNFKKTLVFMFAVALFMTTSVSAQKGDTLPPVKYREITLRMVCA